MRPPGRLARVIFTAALGSACAPEPEAPPTPLFQVVPVASARDAPGAVVVSVASAWFSTPRVRAGATRRQPNAMDRWEVHFERVRLIIGNFRLGRVVTQVGGRRVISTVARDPRTFRAEWSAEDPAGGGASLPLTAFTLSPEAPADAWDAEYTVSFDVGRYTPGVDPTPVLGDSRRTSSGGIRGTHEVTFRFYDHWGMGGDPFTIGTSGGVLQLDAPAAFVDCMNPQAGDGAFRVRPRRDGAARAEATFHADHIFWTALGDEGQRAQLPLLASAPRAQSLLGSYYVDSGLALFDVRGLRGPGDLPLSLNGARPARTLLDFVTESVRTAMHFNGSGRCTVVPRSPH